MSAPSAVLSLLLVDDHPEVCDSLAGFLDQLGHRTTIVTSGLDALAAIRHRRPDLVLTDLRMPGMSGLELLDALEEEDHPPPLALMTAFGDAESAIEALRLGAVDYLRKPIDVRELHRLVERFLPAPAIAPPEPMVSADGVVVAGPDFARVLHLADRLHTAPDLPCLIEAETGCGKELVARRIHHGGQPDDAGPFVAVNCAAIAPGLFEAELFGYAAGAFTGATPGGHPGRLASAEGGTLFLDEIADLPPDQQAKFLRVLEERTWYPVGSNRQQRLRARVVCACNARLVDRIAGGHFREDLYYRLKVGHVRIPPLRERRGEILPLAHGFLQRIRAQRSRGLITLTADAEAFLLAQPWPGNVRQLQHLLEQASLLYDGDRLDARQLADLLPDAAPQTGPGSAGPSAMVPPPGSGGMALPDGSFPLDDWIRAVIAAALIRHDGSPVRTAGYLGITRKVLYTLRKRYGLLRRPEQAGR